MQNQNTITYAFCAVILSFFLLGLFPIFQKLQIRWNSGDNSYCYLIIPLFLYMLWEKKKDFQFGQFDWNSWGLIPILMFLLVMLLGELGSVETLLYIGLWSCVVSTMFILYGWRLKELVYPLLILAFMVPLPPFINRMLTFNLKLAASNFATVLLRLADQTVLQNGNIIDLGITQLQVVDACSGMRYFMPLILMALLFGYYFCNKLWQRALLLVFVAPLSIAVNGMRIFMTGMLHVWGYPQLAESFFHDFSGWIIFVLAGIILLAFCLVLRLFNAPPAQSKPKQVQKTQPVRKWTPAALTITICILFGGSGYALHKLPTAVHSPERQSFESFPGSIGLWNARRNYLAPEILDVLWADDYLSASWHRQDRPNIVHLLVPYYKYQGTRHTAHAPQSCMLGSGWALTASADQRINLNPHGDIPIRTIVWQQGNTRLLAGYFFLQRGRIIINPWMNKFYLMWDSLTRRRTDGALVRAELVMTPGQTIDEAFVVLEDFLKALWPILPEFVPF